MLPDLTESMKRAALQAMEASKPVSVVFGTVIREDPLLISIEQKMTLGMDQLILCRHVTDHDIDATVDWTSKGALGKHRHDTPVGATNDVSLAHAHGIHGRKSMRVHMKLLLGERVALLRLQGGQRYLVWDRVG